ncbi:MAG: flagellar biosynthesis anti-sigma factor FlgM [Gammaproteobacteria bacterium]|jgi:negative regulator of flagellin synthesis FlgM|nr:flagellar biosynthesis anti-sigma factor FlgM [Gammaproteobacteria bacterium]
MTDKITNQTNAGFDISKSKARNVGRPEQAGDAGSKAKADAPRDAVELTNTATNLKRIEANLANLPEVDRSRVDDVRHRLQSGSYDIDHQALAEKMLKLDQDLS